VHADEPARQRERVEHRVADREEHEVERARWADRHQLVAQVVQVFGGFSVGQIARVAPHLEHDLLSQPTLDGGRQFLGAHLAQRGQLQRLRLRLRGGCERGRVQRIAQGRQRRRL
jgi:hypothetical protein